MAGVMTAAAMITSAALAQDQEGGEKKSGRMECRVAFVNLARVLEESKQGKKIKQDLEAEQEKAFAPLKARQAELEEMEKRINQLTQEIIQKSQVWDEYTKLSKQNELQTLQMRYNNVMQTLRLDKSKIQRELNDKKDTMLKPFEEKLNAVMEDIGSKGEYCLVLDVSPPTPNVPNFNPILYRDPSLDITDRVIEAVDERAKK